MPRRPTSKRPGAFNAHNPGDGGSGLVQPVFRSPARIPAAESTQRTVRRAAKRKTLYVITSVRVNSGRNRRNRRLARVWAMGRGGVDLNEVGPPVLLFRGDIPGEANVYGQAPVRPADGFSAVDDICADCRAV